MSNHLNSQVQRLHHPGKLPMGQCGSGQLSSSLQVDNSASGVSSLNHLSQGQGIHHPHGALPLTTTSAQTGKIRKSSAHRLAALNGANMVPPPPHLDANSIAMMKFHLGRDVHPGASSALSKERQRKSVNSNIAMAIGMKSQEQQAQGPTKFAPNKKNPRQNQDQTQLSNSQMRNVVAFGSSDEQGYPMKTEVKRRFTGTKSGNLITTAGASGKPQVFQSQAYQRGSSTSDIYNYTDGENTIVEDDHQLNYQAQLMENSEYNYFGGGGKNYNFTNTAGLTLGQSSKLKNLQYSSDEGTGIIQGYNENIEGLLDEMKVEDYNDQQMLIAGESPVIQGNPDYGNGNLMLQGYRSASNFRKQSHLLQKGLLNPSQDYNNKEESKSLERKDTCFKVPAFLVRSSLDNQHMQSSLGKEQFYMTQVLGQNIISDSNGKAMASKTNFQGAASSSNLKVSRAQKMKQSTSNTSTKKSTSTSYLAKSYASATIKNLQNYQGALSSDLNTSSAVKRGSVGASAFQISQVPHPQAGKDFFNSTAPINLNKLLTHNPQSHQERISTLVEGKALGLAAHQGSGAGGIVSQYYSTQGLTGKPSIKHQPSQYQHHLVSPVKTAKKQLLIQSILNSDIAAKQSSGTLQNGKYFLNMTLQQLIQNQLSSGSTSNGNAKDLIYKAQQQNQPSANFMNAQKRLNKTLDNVGRGHPLSGSEGAPAIDNQYYLVVDSEHLQDTTAGSTGKKIKYKAVAGKAVVTQQKPGSKLSSTMRIPSDFNQTQQLQNEFKNATSSLGNGSSNYVTGNHQMVNNEALYQSDGFKEGPLSMGRKSKSSLKSTQNLNFQATGNHTYQPRVEDKKSQAPNIQLSKTASKKSASKLGAPQMSQPIKPTSQHRKQSSQLDNEKEMLKKMMNFYQDDFLTKFQVPQLGGPPAQFKPSNQLQPGKIQPAATAMSNTRLSLNNSNQQYSGAVSKSASKNSISNKHKANSTLNHYLQYQQNQKSKPSALDFAQTSSNFQLGISAEKQVLLNEPTVVISKNATLKLRSNILEDKSGEQAAKDLESSSQNLLLHPYNFNQPQSKQTPSKNSASQAGLPQGRKQYVVESGRDYNKEYEQRASAYQSSTATKEFQNKTQPIPKHILEIVNQEECRQIISGTGQIMNLSSGTSIGTQIQKRTSVQSKDHLPHTEPPNAMKASAKPMAQNQVPLKNIHIDKLPQKKRAGKNDEPSEAYTNKKTSILEDQAVIKRLVVQQQQQNKPEQLSNQLGQQMSESNNEDNEEIEEEGEEEYDCQSESSDENTKLSRFILGKQIGQGAYAVVRIATRKRDNKKFAMKVYDKSKLTDTNRQRSVRREIKLLQKMNHANIVKIYEAFETDDFVYLVMEYVEGGSLHTYLRDKPDRRLDENDAKRIFKQILTALQYCHRKSIAHRDIKLENILLDEENNVKLIDFGFSTCIPNDKKIKMFCGTPSYMAPEIVMKEEYAGPPADIWASAVLLYALMNGCFPFRGATDKELYRRIQRGTFVLHNQTVSDQFIEFLTRMLNTNADDRPSAEDLLSDSWFTLDQTTHTIAQKAHADSIAEQKRLFKEKILGKVPVEKTKNTICLGSSQELTKKLPAQVNPPQSQVPINGQQAITTEFSDYGLQQQNVMKKLNHEAYQAYYNTSGANAASNGNGAIQNPYYNNFFQNNYLGNVQIQNTHQQQAHPAVYSPNNAAYPVGGGVGANVRNSPGKEIHQQHHQQLQQQHPQPLQMASNYLGTPQVFGSPTAGFTMSGGLISNNFNIPQNRLPEWLELGKDKQVNFNIINNIIMNQQQPVPAQGSHTLHPACLSSAPLGQKIEVAHEQARPSPFLVKTENYPREPLNQLILDPVQDIDDEIVNSITQLGFNRSQVVTQLLMMSDQQSQGGGHAAALGGKGQLQHINELYTKMKEEKLSKTTSAHQNRAHSQQPNNRRPNVIQGVHNFGVYPKQFVPSIPEEGGSNMSKDLLENLLIQKQKNCPITVKNAYADEAYSSTDPTHGAKKDDFQARVASPQVQKSPRIGAGVPVLIKPKVGYKFK